MAETTTDPNEIRRDDGAFIGTFDEATGRLLLDAICMSPSESLRLAHAILARSWVRCEEREPPFDEPKLILCGDCGGTDVLMRRDKLADYLPSHSPHRVTHWQERIPPPPKES